MSERHGMMDLHRRLKGLADPDHAKVSQWFFKTRHGEYGEGDTFLGIRVPVLRGLVREYATLDRRDVAALLRSPWHEERLLAALLLVRQYDRGNAADRLAIYRLYLRSTRFLNNWDIVDASAPQIVGRHLDGKGRAALISLAKARLLWSRRIAVVATLFTIKRGDFDDTIAVATLLLNDPHDLIQKATGWRLREVGKRDRQTLLAFLDQHAAHMPRTMLRYAIERLPDARRRYYRELPR